MKRSQFGEQLIAFELRQAEEGTAIADACIKAGISEATLCEWLIKFGGLMPSGMKCLKHPEQATRGQAMRAHSVCMDPGRLAGRLYSCLCPCPWNRSMIVARRSSVFIHCPQEYLFIGPKNQSASPRPEPTGFEERPRMSARAGSMATNRSSISDFLKKLCVELPCTTPTRLCNSRWRRGAPLSLKETLQISGFSHANHRIRTLESYNILYITMSCAVIYAQFFDLAVHCRHSFPSKQS